MLTWSLINFCCSDLTREICIKTYMYQTSVDYTICTYPVLAAVPSIMDPFQVMISDPHNSDDIKSLNSTFDSISSEMQNLSDEVEVLSGDIEEYFQNNDEAIDFLEANITDANNKIDDVEDDFQSLADGISEWRITVDERLNQTENEIQDLNEIISGTTTTESPATTTMPSTPDECA